jgi:pilus assembly protein Flp/PilA
MKSLFNRFVKNESGATAIEYALIAAIIGVGIVAALQSLKTQMNTTFNETATKMKAN